MKNIDKISLSVALPLYRSKDIAWIAMESLLRQKDIDFNWELLVSEEQNKQMFGKERILEYEKKLMEVGCSNIIYIPLDKWIPLSAKWLILASAASNDSKGFLLQAADCYSSHKRLKNTKELLESSNADWVHSNIHAMYDIKTDTIAYIDVTNHDKPLGSDMAIKTDLVKQIRSEGKKIKGVDFWLFEECRKIRGGNWKVALDKSDSYKYSLNIHGLNNISCRTFSDVAYNIKPQLEVDKILPDNLGARLKRCKKFLKKRKILKEVKISRKINHIQLPSTNVYFERSSADGFAFLGAAKEIWGVNSDHLFTAIKDRNFSLNAPQVIKKTPIPKKADYIYTIWACSEFLRERNDMSTFKMLLDRVDRIGSYKDGMIRYCSTEPNYVVPNVTSAAALLYAVDNQYDKSKKLIEILAKKQEKGNWTYKFLLKKKRGGQEDIYHLSMMIYHFREISRISSIDTSSIVTNALKRLMKNYKRRIALGQAYIGIDWETPMIYLAITGVRKYICDKEEYRKFKTLKKRLEGHIYTRTIKDENFRVRAISAWALSKARKFT